MTNRRKFLAGVGALATGSAAAVGTGAFTSVSAQRNVSVQLSDDSNAFLKLEPGTSGLVSDNGDGLLDINIDGTDAMGSGANMNAVTEIGDPENPSDEYAFAVKNQGTQKVMFQMAYYLRNPASGIDGSHEKSYIQFTVHDAGGNDGRTGSNSEKYPNPDSANQDRAVGNPTGSNTGANTGTYAFDVGETYYVTITIDTTGDEASASDDLSGVAVVAADTETDGLGWRPSNGPSEIDSL